MTTPRPSLLAVKLTGPRAIIRRAAFALIAIAASTAFIGYLLPAHRLDDETTFHSNFTDGGPTPLFLLGAVAAIAVLLRKKAIGAGMATGVAAAGGAILSLAPVLLVHLFFRYEQGIGEHVFAAGMLATFFLGAAFFIVEPILYVLERRRIERAARPAPLPVAIATRT